MWMPEISKADGPVYLAIADALGADIRNGRLATGDRLPPQRALADALGIDFTTVRRAYAEAGRRGLVDGRVGQGTFVRESKGVSAPPAARAVVDMSMNFPPPLADSALAARMWDGIGRLEAMGGADLLLKYQSPGGSPRDRAAAGAWIGPRFGEVDIDRILLTPGTQGALSVVLGLLAAPGDEICAEALTYPGLRALAAHQGLRLVDVAMDDKGLLPDAFDARCRDRAPKALYCNPVLHNPTTITLDEERRRAIVEIARKYGVAIIEDDAYGALPDQPGTPFAVLAPELTWHIAGLAKCLAPALRVSYLIAPDGRAAARGVTAVRATAGMVSPLTAAIATQWIEDGTAVLVRDAIRAESCARQSMVAQILPAQLADSDRDGFHVWLRLPAVWHRSDFLSRLRAEGVGVVASDAFALGTPPEAVRLGLGAAGSREELAASLKTAADLLWNTPELSSMVV